ncbi:hypothetical protein PFISCL1PPCAC_2893, partial [Pristionchus fissidentatus]
LIFRMATLLAREESVTSIDFLRALRERIDSSVIVDGLTYDVRDPSNILIFDSTNEEPRRVATKVIGKYPNKDMLSNFVFWRGFIFCVSNGILWSLNLNDFTWRNPQVRDVFRQCPLWEDSTNEDLLILTDETKGLFLLVRFRPNLQECQ